VGKDFGVVAVEALMSYVDNKEYANCLQWINFEINAKAPKINSSICSVSFGHGGNFSEHPESPFLEMVPSHPKDRMFMNFNKRDDI